MALFTACANLPTESDARLSRANDVDSASGTPVASNGRPFSSMSGRSGKTTSSGLNAYGVPSRSNRSTPGIDNNGSYVDPETVERIRVCVRKRPLSNRELQRGEKDIADVTSRRTVLVNEPK